MFFSSIGHYVIRVYSSHYFVLMQVARHTRPEGYMSKGSTKIVFQLSPTQWLKQGVYHLYSQYRYILGYSPCAKWHKKTAIYWSTNFLWFFANLYLVKSVTTDSETGQFWNGIFWKRASDKGQCWTGQIWKRKNLKEDNI